MNFDSTAPCEKCPYKLGIIKTLVNPCPQCRMTNYSAYKQYIKRFENDVKDNNENK